MSDHEYENWLMLVVQIVRRAWLDARQTRDTRLKREAVDFMRQFAPQLDVRRKPPFVSLGKR